MIDSKTLNNIGLKKETDVTYTLKEISNKYEKLLHEVENAYRQERPVLLTDQDKLRLIRLLTDKVLYYDEIIERSVEDGYQE